MDLPEKPPTDQQPAGPVCGLKEQLTTASPNFGKRALSCLLIALVFIIVDIAILLYVMLPKSDDKEVVQPPVEPVTIEETVKE